jgi:AcrR family transcriptional regulator
VPRHADKGLDERILNSAETLWRRGGETTLTMRAVATAAGTNTPAVYRRFKNREDLLRGMLRRITARLRDYLELGQTVREIAEAYLDYALRNPNEYRLFSEEVRFLDVPKRRGMKGRIRESRPNFAFAEQALAKELGGKPEDHTQLALQIWAISHGTAMMLLAKTIPEGHEEYLKDACRAGIAAMIEQAKKGSPPD